MDGVGHHGAACPEYRREFDPGERLTAKPIKVTRYIFFADFSLHRT